MSFPLQNISGNSSCSGLTAEQVTAITLTGSILAAFFSLSWLLVLAAVLVHAKCYYHRVCGTTVKRLVIGLTMYTVVYQIILSLQLVHYFNPKWEKFCEIQGFLVQYLASVELLFTLSISLVLFFEMLIVSTSSRFLEYYKKAKESTSTCCGWKIKKLEIAIFTSVYGLPLIFDLIPFTTNSYGPIGPWCWIRNVKSDCSPHKAGLWEQIWLLIIPTGFVVLITLVLFTTSLCFLRQQYGRVKNIRVALIEVIIADSVFFLVFLAVMLVMWSPLVILKHASFVIWMILGISTPSMVALVPLVLLIAIHLPISSVLSYARCKRQGAIHREGNSQATLHVSSEGIRQPSHTTWNPLHSSNEHSEIVPIVRGQQHRHYGNINA